MASREAPPATEVSGPTVRPAKSTSPFRPDLGLGETASGRVGGGAAGMNWFLGSAALVSGLAPSGYESGCLLAPLGGDGPGVQARGW